MTRRTGQVSAPQAVVGALVVLTLAAGIVAGLDRLLERDEPRPPLQAPTETVGDRRCPDRVAATASSPTAVTADALVECPHAYDRTTVAYRGEVVRAVLRRGDRAFVQLNDDPYGLGLGPLPEHRTAVGGNSGVAVSVPAAAAERITQVGDARHHGDVLAVTGTFRRADPADGGGPTIQADNVEILQAGRPVDRPVNPARALVAGALGVTALGITAGARARARR